jgi:hypothetical protein
MKFRLFLKIAFSTVCIALCLLNLALHRRSYECDDILKGRVFGVDLELESRNGQQQVNAVALPRLGPESHSSGPIFHLRTGSSDLGGVGRPGWGFHIQRTPIFVFQLAIPHVGLATILAAFAAIPWVRVVKKFGLRTLLIATTVIAVALGVGVYIARG